jgi:hypothetical protein
LTGGVEVASVLVETGAEVIDAGASSTVVVALLAESAVSIVAAASFGGATCAVLDASASASGDDEASSETGEIGVASIVVTGEEDASTWAEASRISKILAKPAANRTTRPIPAVAMTFVFIQYF